MQYSSLVYNLLQSVVWGITPALSAGPPGTRLAVGVPEKIPDIVFIARIVTAADGITPQAERDRLNGFTNDARAFYRLYGFAEHLVGSFEAILNHFATATAPIGRILLISHGDNAYMFFPMFEGGSWDIGLKGNFVQALNTSDEAGIRHRFRQSATQSPLFVDVVADMVRMIRAENGPVLAPFGIQASGDPPAPALPYFQIVNDLYQANHGTTYIGTNTMLTTAQRNIVIAALNYIEEKIRGRLAGTVIAGAAVTDPQLTTFRDAVLAVAPGPLGMFGRRVNLAAGTVAAVLAATNATPRVEADIRRAFTGGTVRPRLFQIDGLNSLVASLEQFNPTVLNQGGTTQTSTSIRADANLLAFAFVAVDMFLLNNGVVKQDGTVLSATDLATLRDGLVALANITRARIPVPPFNLARLNVLRDAIANIPYRQSLLMGGLGLDAITITELQAATASLRANFRTKLDHFRSLMQPADASKFDIRGCLIGQTPPLLDGLREFTGTATNRAVFTAPSWFQAYPRNGGIFRPSAKIADEVAARLAAGAGPNITGADIRNNRLVWAPLIDFDDHFNFITALFGAAASKRDFASLRWRAFRGPSAPAGIPVMRLQASRIDTIDTLSLGDAIEQFRKIFEIATGSAPNPATRTKLTSLSQHVVRLKTIEDGLAALGTPTTTQLDQFITELSALVTSITAVNLPGGTAPTAPAAGSPSTVVQVYVGDIGIYIDAKLDAALNPFFTAMQGAIANVNSALNYWFSSGMPLLMQSSVRPQDSRVSSFVAPDDAVGTEVIRKAIRSWMRIQWEGSAAQAAAMNTVIDNVPMGTTAERNAAVQLSMLTELSPAPNPNCNAVVSPMPNYFARIVQRPP